MVSFHVAGAAGREDRGERRGEDPADAGVIGDTTGVQGAVAAVGQHGEVLRKVSPDPQFLGHADRHLLVDRVLDDLGDLDGIHVQVIGEDLVDGVDGTLLVQLDIAVGVVVRIQVPQDQVGVRDRGAEAAAVVARGARIGTC